MEGQISYRIGEGEWVTVNPDQWGMLRPFPEVSALHVTAQARWRELRFAVMPQREEDPGSEALWGVGLPELISVEAQPHLRNALQDILSGWWRDPWHQARADARLALLLLDVVQLFREEQPLLPRLKDAFRPADEIWATRPLAPIEEVANACHLSERHFRRRFAESRGCSPSSWVRKLVIRQACELLKNRPDWSIEQIALHLGYRHASTFIRAFTRDRGSSPSQWQRQKLNVSG